MPDEIYYDNSATTRTREESAKLVYEMLTDCYGNPSSLHRRGFLAQQRLDKAREQTAETLGCQSGEIYFTSGGTEADNIAILGAARAQQRMGKKIVTTAIEHDAVLNTVKFLEGEGGEIVRLKPDREGKITALQVLDAVDNQTVLVSMMAVNNEVGSVLPVAQVSRLLRKEYPRVLLHCDAVQAWCKQPLRLGKALDVDFLSVSGHKSYAPKGCGALYVKKGLRLPPLTFGGGQERGMRPGTEAVPNIAAFAKACEIRMAHFDEDYAHVQELADYLKQQVSAELPDAVINGEGDIPHVVNLSMPGCKSEVMLHVLEGDEVYISSGSACSKGKQSGVLKALGLPKARTDSAPRISFAPFNTKEDVDAFVAAVKKGAKMFRR